MSRIVFATFFDAGHIFPTFKIAKRLQARGHDVVYLAIEDVRSVVEREGLAFVPVFSDLMPKGYWAERSARRARARGLGLVREWRRGSALATRLIERALAGELDPTLRRLSPDLVIFDNLLPWFGLLAHGLGYRSLQLDTNVPWRREHLVPPFQSAHIPRDDLATRVSNAYTEAKASAFLAALNAFGAAVDVFDLVRRFARRAGYPLSRIETGSGFPILDFPELVLSPRQFVEMGFPLRRGHYHFVEASIDLERRGETFPWQRLNEGRPLLFASLGTINWQARARHRFFRAFDAALCQRPEWQGVAAIGTHVESAGFRAPNLLAVPFAPQLALLERAQLALVHGGFNSVKECIYFGVPMLVFPCHSDQPSNSARVVYHGLGLRADPGEITGPTLLELLDRMMLDPGYRQRTLALSRIFRDAEEQAPSIHVIEGLLAAPLVRRPAFA